MQDHDPGIRRHNPRKNSTSFWLQEDLPTEAKMSGSLSLAGWRKQSPEFRVRVAEICKRVSRGTAVDTRPRNSDLWPSTKLQILTQASQSQRSSRHLRARHSLCCCLGAMSCGTGVTLLPILISSYTTP